MLPSLIDQRLAPNLGWVSKILSPGNQNIQVVEDRQVEPTPKLEWMEVRTCVGKQRLCVSERSREDIKNPPTLPHSY